MMANMLQHMDSYYLRRILNRLVDNEKNQMLYGRQNYRIKAKGSCQDFSEASGGKGGSNFNDENKDSEQDGGKQGLVLNQMEQAELQALHKIVSVIHDTVNMAGQNQSVPPTSPCHGEVSHDENHKVEDSCAFEDDPIASVLWTLKPLGLQKVFLAMVHSFPRTLEAFILHALSPMAAEVLTQKFDEMDQLITKRQQREFYELFYSVFDDPLAAMNSILNGKESFAFLACRNVLDQYLGVNISKQE